MKACRLAVIALLAFLPLVVTSSASSGGDYHFDIDSITTEKHHAPTTPPLASEKTFPRGSASGIKPGKENFFPLNPDASNGNVMPPTLSSS